MKIVGEERLGTKSMAAVSFIYHFIANSLQTDRVQQQFRSRQINENSNAVDGIVEEHLPSTRP